MADEDARRCSNDILVVVVRCWSSLLPKIGVRPASLSTGDTSCGDGLVGEGVLAASAAGSRLSSHLESWVAPSWCCVIAMMVRIVIDCGRVWRRTLTMRGGEEVVVFDRML